MTELALNRPKCESLSPAEADALFFPGSGGKPHKAYAFCQDCPTYMKCLETAVALGSKGFWCGMTDEERNSWARNRKIHQSLIISDEEIEETILLPIDESKEYHSWMDEIEPSDMDIFSMESTTIPVIVNTLSPTPTAVPVSAVGYTVKRKVSKKPRVKRSGFRVA